MPNRALGSRPLIFGSLLALCSGCGDEGPFAAEGSPETALPPAAADLVAQASAEPAILDDGTIELRTTAATLPSAQGFGRWRRLSSPLEVRVATDGSGRSDIRIPGTNAWARVSRVAPEATPAGQSARRAATANETGTIDASLEGSAVRLRQVAPHVDALLFGLERGLEELWVLGRPEARVEYQVDLPPGYTLRESSDAAEIVDGSGSTRLRVIADRAWDAAGRELGAAPIVAGDRLRVEVQGEPTWPLTIDPLWQGPGAELQLRRKLHAATLLADGRVLITGGLSAGEPTDRAELYDPITARFEEVLPGMTDPRAGHTATLLRDGTVLIAGGDDVPAELFDPVRLTFESLGPLREPRRAGHTATLLHPDAGSGIVGDEVHPGIVLLAGGCVPDYGQPLWRTCGDPLASAEVYDGQLKRFITLDPPAARAQHTATLQYNGIIVFAGGIGVSAESEMFLPAPPPEVPGPRSQYGRFVAAPSLDVGRSSHTATLLHEVDGNLEEPRILLVGNAVTQENAESAAVWDPTPDGTTTPLPPLHTVRSWHTATLLPTGRVLLAGGISPILSSDDYPPLEATEFFDPDNADFVMQDDLLLNDARAFHTSTLLPNGTVLVTGGSRRGGSELSSAEVFVAEVGSFEDLGTTVVPDAHTATLLPPEPGVDEAGEPAILPPHRVLVIAEGRGAQSTTDLFELDLDSAETFPIETLHESRRGHTATLLRDGSVLIVGGEDFRNGAELYVAGRRERVRDLRHARRAHTATLLPSGAVLIAGGTDVEAPVEVFDPGTGSFQEVEQVSLPPLIEHTATLLPDGRVVIAGGRTAPTANPERALFVYEPRAEGAGRVAQAATSMNEPRAGHTATVLPGGTVLITGGYALDSAELLRFGPDEVRVEPLSPGLGEPRARHTATLLVDGRVLLIGGGSGSELYDPMTKGFVEGPALNAERNGHSATLLPDAGVLVLGGGSDRRETWHDDASHPDVRRAEVRDIAGYAQGPSALVSLLAGVGDRAINGPALFLGEKFTCMSEASGGRLSTSSTNHPVAYWMPLNGGYASVGGVTQWSSEQGRYTPPMTPFPGPGLLFLVTNGIRSAGRMVTVEPAPRGKACSSGSECEEGFCGNGVCCDPICDGDVCHTCSAQGACVEREEGADCSGEQPAHCFLGECQPGCTSNYDCPDGVCGVDGLCRNPITPAESSGCAVPARSGGSDGAFIAGLLLLAALGRRAVNPPPIARAPTKANDDAGLNNASAVRCAHSE